MHPRGSPVLLVLLGFNSIALLQAPASQEPGPGVGSSRPCRQKVRGGQGRAVPLKVEGSLLSCERALAGPGEEDFEGSEKRRPSRPEQRVRTAEFCIQEECKGQTRTWGLEGQTKTGACTLEPWGHDLVGKAGTPHVPS